MPYLLDTDVAIHLRDRDPYILERLGETDAPPFLSVISQAEMEGGVYAKPQFTAKRRIGLDILLARATVLPFDSTVVLAYREIVATAGFSRRKIADRMVAATALVHGLTLITMNGKDFGDIPSLKLEIWPNPAG